MTEYKLDDQDKIIISHLQKDGRKSYKDIADEMGVSNVSVHNRYKRLIKENILHIVGWANPKDLDLNCHALVLLNIDTSKHLENAINSLAKLKWVDMVCVTAGKFILEVEILCRDNEHLFDIVNESIMSLDGITDTHITPYLEVYFDDEDNTGTSVPVFRGLDATDNKNKKLDETNLKLIDQIQADGRKSFKDIAKAINVSVNTIRSRVEYLINHNIITVYAWVQPKYLGFGSFCRVLIFLKSTDHLQQVVRDLAQIKYVRYIASSSERHQIEITMLCEDNFHMQQVRVNDIHGIEGVVDTEVITYLKVLVHNGRDVRIK